MKKDKAWATSLKGGFSLAGKAPPPEEMFAGYPDFNIDNAKYKDDPCAAIEATFERMREIMLWSDDHPPYFPGSLHARNIWFAIIFESVEQADDFSKQTGLDKYGDKYLLGEEFAEVFGIDMEKGTMKLPPQKKNKAKPNFMLNLNFKGSQADFSKYGKKKKPEISEKLKSIRMDEKQLAQYMKWTGDTDYHTCICFNTEKEKENTVKALGLELEYEGKYLWCHDVARVVGVELIPCDFKNKGAYNGREKKLEEMVWDPERDGGR